MRPKPREEDFTRGETASGWDQPSRSPGYGGEQPGWGNSESVVPKSPGGWGG